MSLKYFTKKLYRKPVNYNIKPDIFPIISFLSGQWPPSFVYKEAATFKYDIQMRDREGICCKHWISAYRIEHNRMDE